MPISRSASLSCGPQSHLSDPNTSPVRHSLWSRTSGGFPPNAPTSKATCSWPSSDARKAKICVSGMSSSGSLARATTSATSGRVESFDTRFDRHGFGAVPADPRATVPAAGRAERARAPGRSRFARRLNGSGCERPERRAVEILRRVGQRQRGVGVEPGSRAISTGCRRIGGVALVRERQGSRPPSADQQRRRGLRIEQSPAIPASPSRPRRRTSGWRPFDPHGAAGAQRGDRPLDRSGAAQTATSQISGTWSDGRSQLRQGSSTRCARTRSAASGEAHIWSSRRPRSFLVQSGER